MEINETKEGTVIIATIAGRLDYTNYIGIEKKFTAIINKNERNILLDCTELEYINSAGLRALIGILKKMTAVEGKFSLCTLNSKVEKIFKISGFLKLFTIYETRSEALKELAE